MNQIRAHSCAVLLAAAVVQAGCETIGQDVKDITTAFNPTTPREAAVMMVDPYDNDNRRLGTVLISNASFGGAEVYVKQYRDAVDNERDPIVKAAAIRALAKHGEAADAVRILPHLSHENVQVRWEAAKGLQRLHNPAAVTDLLKTLRTDTERSDVRIASAVALGQYPEDRVFQGLVGALNARELAINMAAQRSLETLTGRVGQDSGGLDSVAWLTWYNKASAANEAFADRQEYLFPTYSRPDTIWENMAFWSQRNFESPAQPAGLRPKSERQTYDDETPAESESTGGL